MDRVLTPTLTASLTQEALNSSGVAIDTETTGVNIRDGRDHAVGISIAYRAPGGITAFYLPFRHGDSGDLPWTEFHGPIQRILAEKPVVFHNAKFDLVSLQTLGFDTSMTRFYDTMLLAHLVDENKPYSGKGLDSLAKFYLNDPGKLKTDAFNKIVKHAGWEYLSSDIMAPYAAKDAELTYRLFEFLKDRYQKEIGAPDVWLHKEMFTRVIMEMELKGIGIDTELAKQQAAIGEARMLQILHELNGLNPASPKDLYKLICLQLGLPEILSKKTGRRTFDKEAMLQYEEVLSHINDPTAQRILEYRGWQKTVSSNYRSYLELLSPDGRLRPNYKLHGTRTGRLSCENPNLQQIPRQSSKPWNGHLKKTFLPNEGYTLMEFDYSQLELRLGTAYAQEPHLMEVFNEGRDIFTEMAQKVGLSRQDTKTMVYSIQYGAGISRIANVFGISPAQAKERIDNYYESFPKFRRISNGIGRTVAQHGKVQLWSGRYRHFEYPREQYYKAFNSVIQGGAADIVERVMVRLSETVANDTDCRMLLTVHDSVVFEIRNDVIKDATEAIQKVMVDVDAACGKEFGVTFAVEGKEWGK